MFNVRDAYAIGKSLPSIAWVAQLEASVSKISLSLKFGNCKIASEVKIVLNTSNEFWALKGQTNSASFNKRVNGLAIFEKSFIFYDTRPENCLTCFTFLGTRYSEMSSTFLGLGTHHDH